MIKSVVLGLSMVLTACSMGHFQRTSSNVPTPNASMGITATGEQTPLGAKTVPGVAIGGSVARWMDAQDRVKLMRALDKAPGKPTEWVNGSNGTRYTVTPIKKLSVNGNSLCRQYQVVSERGGHQQQVTGTACIAADGVWSEVN